MNTVTPGRIRASGNHASVFGPATYGEGLAGQTLVMLLFYRAEESIQIQV